MRVLCSEDRMIKEGSIGFRSLSRGSLCLCKLVQSLESLSWDTCSRRMRILIIMTIMLAFNIVAIQQIFVMSENAHWTQKRN